MERALDSHSRTLHVINQSVAFETNVIFGQVPRYITRNTAEQLKPADIKIFIESLVKKTESHYAQQCN